MRRIPVLTLFSLFSCSLFAQFVIDRNEIYGGNSLDEAKDIAFNPAKTFLFFGGRSFSSDGNLPGNSGASDFWIMKQEADGTPVWSRNYGGNGNDDLVSIMPHTDGGVLAFGTTHTSHGAFGTINGLAGGWLMRTNTTGTIIDGKIFGGFTTETAVDATRHVSGDVTMLMESTSTNLNGQMNHGMIDVWVVRVDANLDIQWTSLLGADGVDRPAAIAQDINGNTYVAAFSDSDLPNLPPNQGKFDAWIMKLAPNGDMIWERSFGGAEDDIPTDILIRPDGNVYVMVNSKSTDGDFDENEGIGDVWMLQLADEDGTLITKTRYGGSGNDFDAHLDDFDEDLLVLTMTTTSTDGDITGNKGFADVWVVMTDLNGTIYQQMNYGGTLNDIAVDIMVEDSIFHVLNNSLSSNANVPSNALAQQDMWYFTLDTDPDTCSFNFFCTTDTTLTNEIYPPDNNALLCVSGCNAGYGPGPDFAIGSGCADFTNATAYFKIITDTLAELMTLSVTSNDFNKPRISIFKTFNCTTYQEVLCATGEFGSVLLSYFEIDPLTTYVVAISDEEGNIGDFELCASSLFVDFCNIEDEIYAIETSLGSPLSGPYLPGEEVTICYELTEWEKLECNGFQGLVPYFGPGWDPTSFDLFGQPIQIDSMISPIEEGFWEWYIVGAVHYNISNPVNGYDGGQGMPAGWYFTNTSDPPPATEPDETTGDISSCLPTPDKWKICFTLKVVDECESDLDCSVSMKTFADGELGINQNLACVYDQPEVLHASMRCCINPNIENIQDFSLCSGDTISFTPETNLIPPVTYTWVADADPFIEGASSATQSPFFYQVLTTEAAIPFDVRYSIRAEGGGCFTEIDDFVITVFPRPRSVINSSGPTSICSGSTVNLTFQNTGTPPFIIDVYRDNEPYIQVLNEMNTGTFAVDPEFSSRLTIGDVRDAYCSGGNGSGFVDVTVKPIQMNVIDTALCEGQHIIIDNTIYDETGLFTITLEGGSENNCDSIIELNLDIVPTLTESINETICQGDTVFVLGVPYTSSTSQLIEYTGAEGCPAFIQLDLLVKDTFSSETMETICFGDTVTFFGVQLFQAGTYSHTEEVNPGCFEQTILHLELLPAIIINAVEIVADNGSNNGAILVEFVGGNPPFSYKWDSGQMSESLFGIEHGTYTITVTDRLGCTRTFEFEVPFINSTTDPAVSIPLVCRPTIAKAGEQVSLVNFSDQTMMMDDIRWIDMTGKPLQSVSNTILEAGQTHWVSIPAQFSSGMYMLRVTLRDKTQKLYKIFIR